MVGWEPNPPRAPDDSDDPGMTMSRFVPIDANASSTLVLAPSPIATMAMTAAMPMMMPSVVRNERILLRKSARTATRRMAIGFMRPPRERSERVRSGRAERAKPVDSCGLHNRSGRLLARVGLHDAVFHRDDARGVLRDVGLVRDQNDGDAGT